MKTLLRIDTSARTNGSHSRSLADHFQARWLATHPEGRVVNRDLTRDPVPHLDQATIDALYAAKAIGKAPPAAALSDTLIAELQAADALVISAPLYNSGTASSLKAYFDHVVRSGRTFTVDDKGRFNGLLTGKTACLITARGGPAWADDFQTPYLISILAFIGITDVTPLIAEGTAGPVAQRDQNLAQARARIDALFTPATTTPPATDDAAPTWIGAFTVADRHAIADLREGQAAAIASGDINRYTRLVVEDVHWMFPGRDVVAGRDNFLAAQRSLRDGTTKILSMNKSPLRIERAGDLAIEIGRQNLVVAPAADGRPTYPPQQKYTHIYRKTPAGWRFAVLMSNSAG